MSKAAERSRRRRSTDLLSSIARRIPLKYVTFFHNFETYLEKDNPDDSRRLQFLIQHCTGKARDAIESCSNLPASEGYRVAKETLRENFGKPHILAGAHIKKLLNLPNLKNAD